MGHHRGIGHGPRGRRAGRGRRLFDEALPPDGAASRRTASRRSTRPAARASRMTRSGFAAIIGRPNVGKSTLLNQVVGTKVSITAASPNTTRQAIRGILTEGDTQIIFVDTPGIHRPRTTLGGRLNDTARAAADGVDVILAVIEAGAAIGRGDRNVLATMLRNARGRSAPLPVVVVNKMDKSGREAVDAQLVRKTKQDLPHSIHTRVTEFEWPHIRVEILVERESQKGMVIGKGGALLKDVGIAARRQLPEGCFLELKVSVEPGWQK